MLRRIICSLAAMLACSAAGASDIRRVVTGLDANNKAVVMFDSRMPLQAGPYGLNATNLWVTNTYPLGFSFKNDTSAIPVGISPLDNGTAGDQSRLGQSRNRDVPDPVRVDGFQAAVEPGRWLVSRQLQIGQNGKFRFCGNRAARMFRQVPRHSEVDSVTRRFGRRG
jgi:hypothetical protein